MRVDLLDRLKTKDETSASLLALDGDFSFFSQVGLIWVFFSSNLFHGLHLHPIGKADSYEAVHEIRSWSDLKNR